MKYLFLLFCLILCSCEQSRDGTCQPIVLDGLEGFTFNSQGGIDSMITHDYLGNLIDVFGEEGWKGGCEVKPDIIECSWFSVMKKDSIIFASVKQNNTGQERYEYVNVKGSGKHGECSERSVEIAIYQCPELLDIELSKDEFLFNSEGGIDSVIVTTSRNSWPDYPLIGVRYGIIRYYYMPGTIYYIWHPPEGFYFEGYPIKDHWFSIIDIIDGKKIILSVNKNESGKERNFTLTLEPYHCGPSIKVVQSAE